ISRNPLEKFNHPGVTELKLQINNSFRSADYLRVANTWPSVTKLELVIFDPYALEFNSNLIDPFWTLWPGLVSLRVKLGWDKCPYTVRKVNLDKILCGIPPSNWSPVKE